MLYLNAQLGSKVVIINVGGNMDSAQGEAVLAAAQALSTALDAEGGELSTKIQAVIDELGKPDRNVTAATELLIGLQERVTKLSDLIPDVGTPPVDTGSTDTTSSTEETPPADGSVSQ